MKTELVLIVNTTAVHRSRVLCCRVR